MRQILYKVFQNRQNNWQFIFAGVGFVIGLLIMLLAIQLYLQIDRWLNERKGDGQYLIISKKIGLGNTLFLSKAEFGRKEIDEISKQPFIAQVGEFTSNQFEVLAYSKRLGFYTELFFESLPDSLLDIQPENWNWNEKSDILPVVLSKDMLDLYNFGYALGKSQGLPQLSESTAKLLTITIRLRGAGGERTFNGRIVGFSERVPSIIVPPKFMRWANAKIGENKKKNPARLLLKIRNPNDTQLSEYLETKNYQVNQEKLQASKAGGVVQLLMSGVSLVGVLFIALSLVVFLMNFRVVLAEAKDEVRLLIQLGYTIQHLANFLIFYFVIWLSLLLIFTYILLYFLINWVSKITIEMGIASDAGMETTVVLCLIGIGLSVISINILSIFGLLRKVSR